MKYFPLTPLSRLLRSYFSYWDIPLNTEDGDETASEDEGDSDDDSLDTILVRTPR